MARSPSVLSTGGGILDQSRLGTPCEEAARRRRPTTGRRAARLPTPGSHGSCTAARATWAAA